MEGVAMCLTGFEPATFRFVVGYSVQLSYKHIGIVLGVEPSFSCVALRVVCFVSIYLAYRPLPTTDHWTI